MELPAALVGHWPGEREWLAALPHLAAECAARWDLSLEEPVETPHSLVVPAGEAVLKLNAPSHVEAEHEGDALAWWSGRGAVRLLARDDARRALLLERCRPGTQLTESREDAAPVVACLLADLRTPVAGAHPFRSLEEEARRWSEYVLRRYRLAGRPFERSLLERALAVFASVDPRAAFLVNADLHGGNVLRARRRPWLVIDPKPLVGEAEIDGVGLLRNAAWTESPSRALRQWLAVLAELGLDRARLVDWGVAHALAWGWDDARGWLPAQVAAARTIATL
ncbi:MAG: aminoglycoside phosphotransferase [Thermoleophilia bacterium]|nr:aminoglycoside phosphotransferase [Thermoleophilia bacterium]